MLPRAEWVALVAVSFPLGALALGLLAPRGAAAQELSATERGRAVSRVIAMSECVDRQRAALAQIVSLMHQAETQRDRGTDARVREDAERAIEALILRASDIQREGRACFDGEALPTPGTRVIERGPPPDANADSIAESGGTVRRVEGEASLGSSLRVVRAEQVDGQGRVDASVIQRGVRGVSHELERCYASYLDRGSIEARNLDLVFTLRGPGSPRDVTVERSGFHDATFERCITGAGQRMRFSGGPHGGEAIFSYTLRFGR
ncbi:MAG: hypothetical protein AB7S26_00535 [Sandaracinaceae bacterium]